VRAHLGDLEQQQQQLEQELQKEKAADQELQQCW
jgi:hypothetical protein